MKATAKKTSERKAGNSIFSSSKNTPFFIAQTKLDIGKPGDKYEQEADRIANKVVSGAPSVQPFFAASTLGNQGANIAGTITPLVQRVEEEKAQSKLIQRAEEEEAAQPKLQRQPMEEEEEMIQAKAEQNIAEPLNSTEQLVRSSKGNGSLLNRTIQAEMEQGFGADFSGVKIHTDSTAVRMNKNLGAQAFTTGNNIYFNEGKYQPDSKNGKTLLAHELTHTVQQGSNLNKNSSKIVQKKEGEPGGAEQALQYTKMLADVHGAVGTLNKYLKNYTKAYISVVNRHAAAKLIANEINYSLGLVRSTTKIHQIKRLAAIKKIEVLKNISKKELVQATKLLSKVKKLERICKPISKFLSSSITGNLLNFGVEYATSTNATPFFKTQDAVAKTVIDHVFVKKHPVIAAIDTIISLHPEGKKYTIGNTIGDSTNIITGVQEAILTGNMSGLDELVNNIRSDNGTYYFKKAIEAGDFWASEGGGYERAKMVGDFWGGPDSVSGRATAFFASVPGIGHVGEGLGWLAFQAYDGLGDALNFTGQKLKEFDEAVMPEGRTLNPMVGINSILDGKNPFW